MGFSSPMHLFLVLVVVLLLFGNRLPSVMRSLGKGMTEFKKGLEDRSDDDEDRRDDRRSRDDREKEPVKAEKQTSEKQ